MDAPCKYCPASIAHPPESLDQTISLPVHVPYPLLAGDTEYCRQEFMVPNAHSDSPFWTLLESLKGSSCAKAFVTQPPTKVVTVGVTPLRSTEDSLDDPDVEITVDSEDGVVWSTVADAVLACHGKDWKEQDVSEYLSIRIDGAFLLYTEVNDMYGYECPSCERIFRAPLAEG
ncbi:hypothetical protein CAC42_4967 [Sphaceloma murrayae]|uniref:Uncharacterized protein n=1 Tax=Sphaceloma murrayae TaxID=2082308 RepID=A0A2K1QQ62_9PEZI|nr:hypothetical protein CAC42_4967 [Sphaceloma murrayae]